MTKPKPRFEPPPKAGKLPTTQKEHAMADLKTKATHASVTKFLRGISDERRQKDSFAVLNLMAEVTKAEPVMWGTSIVGFGRYHYRYASGREGDWPVVGFSPRKQSLTLYIMSGFDGYDELMQKLGKYKTGKACLYIKSLDDVHIPTLKKLVRRSVRHMRETNP
jgi:Domain of unknown function (DU1801)